MKKKADIKLSVILPIYNVEKYLSQCLSSCLCHEDSVEYILIDDGSTDSSYKIAEKYKNNFNNIQLIHQKNQGLSAARNTGVKLAIGEWIYFIDSDDFVSENYINNMLQLIKNIDSKINLINLPIKKYIDGKEIEIQNGHDQLVKSVDFAKSILDNDKQMGVWSYIFKSKYLKKKSILFREGLLFEDQYYIPPIVCDQCNIYVVSNTSVGYYYYRTRKDSISLSKPTLKKVVDKVNAETYRNNYFNNYYKNKKINESVKSSMLSTYFTGMMDTAYLHEKLLYHKYLKQFRKYQKSINQKIGFKQELKIFLTYLPSGLSSFLYYKLNYAFRNLSIKINHHA